jgi:hypothetical protein
MFEKIERSRGFTHCLIVSPDALPLLRVTRHHYFQPAGVAGWDRHGPRYHGTRALNFMPRYQEFSRDQDLLKIPDLSDDIISLRRKPVQNILRHNLSGKTPC